MTVGWNVVIKALPEQRNLLGEFAVGGMLTLYPQKVKSFKSKAAML